MNEYIFKPIDYENDPLWLLKDFFNSMHLQEKFLWMLPYIINKSGCGVNETYCAFPDWNSFLEEEHFDGVSFGIMDDEVIVSEEVCYRYVRLACHFYLELHPEDQDKVWEILKNCPP